MKFTKRNINLIAFIVTLIIMCLMLVNPLLRKVLIYPLNISKLKFGTDTEKIEAENCTKESIINKYIIKIPDKQIEKEITSKLSSENSFKLFETNGKYLIMETNAKIKYLYIGEEIYLRENEKIKEYKVINSNIVFKNKVKENIVAENLYIISEIPNMKSSYRIITCKFIKQI